MGFNSLNSFASVMIVFEADQNVAKNDIFLLVILIFGTNRSQPT